MGIEQLFTAQFQAPTSNTSFGGQSKNSISAAQGNENTQGTSESGSGQIFSSFIFAKDLPNGGLPTIPPTDTVNQIATLSEGTNTSTENITLALINNRGYTPHTLEGLETSSDTSEGSFTADLFSQILGEMKALNEAFNQGTLNADTANTDELNEMIEQLGALLNLNQKQITALKTQFKNLALSGELSDQQLVSMVAQTLTQNLSAQQRAEFIANLQGNYYDPETGELIVDEDEILADIQEVEKVLEGLPSEDARVELFIQTLIGNFINNNTNLQSGTNSPSSSSAASLNNSARASALASSNTANIADLLAEIPTSRSAAGKNTVIAAASHDTGVQNAMAKMDHTIAQATTTTATTAATSTLGTNKAELANSQSTSQNQGLNFAQLVEGADTGGENDGWLDLLKSDRWTGQAQGAANSNQAPVSTYRANASLNGLSNAASGTITAADTASTGSKTSADFSTGTVWGSIIEASTESAASYSANPASSQSLSGLLTQGQSAGAAHPATHMVALSMQKAAQNQNTSLRLSLDPPELGRVEVRMEFGNDNTLKAHMIVEKSDTYMMLQRDSQLLDKALQDLGLDQDAGLSMELAEQGFNFNQGGNERGGSHEQGGTGSSSSSHNSSDDEVDTIESTMNWSVDPLTGHTSYSILA
ncbi:MAG: hypothetical protein CMH26_01250 [Micavibrio sp.]|nr:hypothetical protein [Micavibrio sp.]